MTKYFYKSIYFTRKQPMNTRTQNLSLTAANLKLLQFEMSDNQRNNMNVQAQTTAEAMEITEAYSTVSVTADIGTREELMRRICLLVLYIDDNYGQNASLMISDDDLRILAEIEAEFPHRTHDILSPLRRKMEKLLESIEWHFDEGKKLLEERRLSEEREERRRARELEERRLALEERRLVQERELEERRLEESRLVRELEERRLARTGCKCVML
jgi:hypothetical protein